MSSGVVAPGRETMGEDSGEDEKKEEQSEESGDESSEVDDELPTAEELAKKKTGRFLKTKKYLASRAASSRAVSALLEYSPSLNSRFSCLCYFIIFFLVPFCSSFFSLHRGEKL